MTNPGSAALAINTARATPFANFSNVMLADEMGAIDRHLAELKDRQDVARAEMTRRKLNSIEGSRFIIVRAVSPQQRLDSQGVREEMGDDWYEARQKTGLRTTYTAIDKPPNLDAAPEPSQSSARVAAEALFKAPQL